MLSAFKSVDETFLRVYRQTQVDDERFTEDAPQREAEEKVLTTVREDFLQG